MKFLRHLLEKTKLEKEKNQWKKKKKNWGAEHSKGNKTAPEKVATTCTEDGHK
jgi:ribosomal protein S25